MPIRRTIVQSGSQPEGTVTFNSPGTWVSPSRYIQVTVSGKGAPGNSGNNGNGGNG